jgi:hypothetical protein
MFDGNGRQASPYSWGVTGVQMSKQAAWVLQVNGLPGEKEISMKNGQVVVNELSRV